MHEKAGAKQKPASQPTSKLRPEVRQKVSAAIAEVAMPLATRMRLTATVYGNLPTEFRDPFVSPLRVPFVTKDVPSWYRR